VDDFSELLSDARTFGFYEDAEKLWAAGLAKGASLENTIVIQNEKVMNEGGLRSNDELIRHKVLDAVGDLALAGVTIIGHFQGINSGHALNNQLLRVLFATPDAWTLK
jgi:UDP-3-O-[3-hydroxymyristoyl] N-acetylglucosamine deacetylase